MTLSNKKKEIPTLWTGNIAGSLKKGKDKRKNLNKKKGSKDFKCFNCGKSGYYARDYYLKKQNGGAKAEDEILK